MQAKKKPLPVTSGETSGKGFENHNAKVTTYAQRRKRALLMRRYLGSVETPENPAVDLPAIVADLSSCASWLKFHHYYQIDDTRLAAAWTCKRHLLCPFCAARRASKTVERYVERLEIIAKQNPTLKLAHLVLTVKNGDDLGERMDHLQNAWKRLQQKRRNAAKGMASTEMTKVAGAFFSYEVTNKGNGWHPHLHAVVLLTDWIDRDALVAEWKAITGDSQILWIERIGKGLGTLLDAAGNLNTKVAGAFVEVAKYAVKFSDLTTAKNWEAFQVLRGKRLQGTFGAFRGVQVPESLLDDLLADEPYLELVYRFNGQAYDLTATRKVTP
jgi:hypothetical protein